MTSPLTLLFIRHAESVGNAQGRMMGHLDDALSETGLDQAVRLADRLRTHPPTHMYSSPIARTRQTAELLQRSLPNDSSISIQYVDELKEFQNGIFQGLTWAEASDRYPDLCRALESSLTWIPIPGAESWEQGRDRAQRFIAKLLDSHQDGDRLWIVTHSWILQHLISSLMGCDRTWGFTADYTSIFEFQIWRSHWSLHDQNLGNTELWKIRSFNDSQHLMSP